MPRTCVLARGKLALYRYEPAAAAQGPPLLLVYALVNRPTMLDLDPERSLIRRLSERGQLVYLVDWGYPDVADKDVSLEDYIQIQLGECVEFILAQHRIEALNLLGVCQGGVFALCYTALNPRRVRNLITMVTPVDFQTPEDLLSKWARHIDPDAVAGHANVPGESLNQMFIALMPFRLGQQKYFHLWQDAPDVTRLASFLRTERWLFDSPDQARGAFRQFLQWFYQENRLVRGGLRLGGRAVNLRAIRQPVLNLYGRRDHLVPPASSQALRTLVASEDYSAHEFDLGHIGMFISARAQAEVPQTISTWLAAR